jgi:acetyl-CoA carboxylase carboxyl transferase subunit alpha
MIMGEETNQEKAIDIVKLARHTKRPTTLDYIKYMITEFLEFHGDRRFSDDLAVVGGIGFLDDIPITIIGHQKGRNVKEHMKRNFGMAHPEGYRKAMRLMEEAEQFGRPVINFIDTPGAYPGIGAEERGQAEAIAFNLYKMSTLRTPIISVVTGEGGSGGALAMGLADQVYMLSNAIYSVISPEGCASILWRDSAKAEQAAEALKLTAPHLYEMKIIDKIIEEPEGGAHTDHETTAKRLKSTLLSGLKELLILDLKTLLEQRYQKYRQIGIFSDLSKNETN